jgi:hypothetical protein
VPERRDNITFFFPKGQINLTVTVLIYVTEASGPDVFYS